MKLTLARGASLKDPAHLFNSRLDGNVRRVIDIREGDKINEKALKALIREAVALNRGGATKEEGIKARLTLSPLILAKAGTQGRGGPS